MFLVFAGGVGGSRFVRGLLDVVPPSQVTVVVNTGDDIERFGLHISPDVDINLYALSGRLDESRGWGRAGETWSTQTVLKEELGFDAWFNLGDRDLAVHLYRTQRLRDGASLTQITAELVSAFGVPCRVLPMSDQPVATYIDTDEGEMHFQDYLIRRRCEPRVRGIRLRGIESAQPAPGLLAAIATAEAILIPPSNPLVSVGPILALRGVTEAVRQGRAPVVAVSPLIGGKTVKGPADRMLADLGHVPTAAGVAAWYGDLLDGFVADHQDADLLRDSGAVRLTDTLMSTPEKRAQLAATVVEFARELGARQHG